MNSRLLSDSGGPCECSPELAEDFACRFYDPVYDECVENFRRQLVTVGLCLHCVAQNVSIYSNGLIVSMYSNPPIAVDADILGVRSLRFRPSSHAS